MRADLGSRVRKAFRGWEADGAQVDLCQRAALNWRRLHGSGQSSWHKVAMMNA